MRENQFYNGEILAKFDLRSKKGSRNFETEIWKVGPWTQSDWSQNPTWRNQRKFQRNETGFAGRYEKYESKISRVNYVADDGSVENSAKFEPNSKVSRRKIFMNFSQKSYF